MGGDVGGNMNLFKFARMGNPAFIKTVVQTSGINAMIALVQELPGVLQFEEFHPLLEYMLASVHTATEHAGD